MRTMPKRRHLISAIVLTTFFAMPLYAIAQTEGLPEIMKQNEITYVTGGIGDDEVQALEVAKNDFNLHVLNADSGGAYVSHTHLVIRDKAGVELLSTEAGPIFYANLPAGKYTVDASHNDESKKKTVTLSKNKPGKVNFAWKQVN